MLTVDLLWPLYLCFQDPGGMWGLVIPSPSNLITIVSQWLWAQTGESVRFFYDIALCSVGLGHDTLIASTVTKGDSSGILGQLALYFTSSLGDTVPRVDCLSGQLPPLAHPWNPFVMCPLKIFKDKYLCYKCPQSLGILFIPENFKM